MMEYLRLIRLERWQTNNINTLSGEAITIDWNSKNNEWSVFENENIEDVVLRMIVDNPKKTAEGVELLILKEDFLRKTKIEIVEDNILFNCKHCDIINADYKLLKSLVKYTFDSLKEKCNYIRYSLLDIRHILLSLSSTKKSAYVQYIKDSGKKVTDITRVFLKDKKNFLEE